MQDYISTSHNRADLEKTFWELSILRTVCFDKQIWYLHTAESKKKKWLYYKLIAEISKPHSVIQWLSFYYLF